MTVVSTLHNVIRKIHDSLSEEPTHRSKSIAYVTAKTASNFGISEVMAVHSLNVSFNA